MLPILAIAVIGVILVLGLYITGGILGSMTSYSATQTTIGDCIKIDGNSATVQFPRIYGSNFAVILRAPQGVSFHPGKVSTDYELTEQNYVIAGDRGSVTCSDAQLVGIGGGEIQPNLIFAQEFVFPDMSGFAMVTGSGTWCLKQVIPPVAPPVIPPVVPPVIPPVIPPVVPPSEVCGNGVCGTGENEINCAQDCIVYRCGNGICEGNEAADCPQDCGDIEPPKTIWDMVVSAFTDIISWFRGVLRI